MAQPLTTNVQGVLVDPSVNPPLAVPSPKDIVLPAGQTFDLAVAIVDSGEQPIDLTGGQVLFSVRAKSTDPTARISRQATLTAPTLGLCVVPLAVNDTAALPAGPYSWDLWLTDASGNRAQVVPGSSFLVQPAFGHSGQPVTALPSQAPLAQGPPGLDGLGASLVTSFALDAPIIEIGATGINPTGTSAFSTLPISASLTDGASTQLLTTPFSPWAFTGTYRKTTANATQEFDLSVVDAFSRHYRASAILKWLARAYFGPSAIPGTYDATFVLALGASRLQTGFAQGYTIPGDSGAGTQYPHIALPAAWGDPSQFLEGGNVVPWTKVASNVNVTNVNSIVVPINVWRAPQVVSSAHLWSLS